MRLGPVELYKKLPRTNCGDCGQPTCLAFATMVVGHGHDLKDCPHLDEEMLREVNEAIEAQREKGVYLKRDQQKITRNHLREKIRDHDFKAIAPGLGVRYRVNDPVEALEIPYFGCTVSLTLEDILHDGGEDFDPWDEILLYNYVFFSGSKPLRGEWVGMESFPNSVSKRVALEDGCHRRISGSFAGATTALESACRKLGGEALTDGHNADLGFRFEALPRMPLLLLFWDEDKEEGFEARSKVLFDAYAMEYLDLEGLTFVAEKLAEKLISIRKEEMNV